MNDSTDPQNQNPEPVLTRPLPVNVKNLKELIEAGKESQFKPGNPLAASGGAKSYSVRRQLQCILDWEFKGELYTEDGKLDVKVLDAGIRDFIRDSAKPCKGARIIAARMFEKVAKKVPADMADKLIEHAEGKQVQPISQEPPPVQYDLSEMTPEQIAEAYYALCQQK